MSVLWAATSITPHSHQTIAHIISNFLPPCWKCRWNAFVQFKWHCCWWVYFQLAGRLLLLIDLPRWNNIVFFLFSFSRHKRKRKINWKISCSFFDCCDWLNILRPIKLKHSIDGIISERPKYQIDSSRPPLTSQWNHISVDRTLSGTLMGLLYIAIELT